MAARIGINGFGRIGRNILRALLESGRTDLEVAAINDLAPIDMQAHLFKYDSVHGRYKGAVDHQRPWLQIQGNKIRCTSEPAPENLNWSDVDVDIVLECTGRFTTKEAASRHLSGGAQKVLVSAPMSSADKTIVFGVNHNELTIDDVVVSNASCTTNCLAPLAMVLDREFGIESGYMTTIHSYTGDQPVLDAYHKNPYRARAASLSMIPTSTGAASSIGIVLPQLAGKLKGSAIRVPTPNVSAVDLCFVTSRSTSIEEINSGSSPV